MNKTESKNAYPVEKEADQTSATDECRSHCDKKIKLEPDEARSNPESVPTTKKSAKRDGRISRRDKKIKIEPDETWPIQQMNDVNTTEQDLTEGSSVGNRVDRKIKIEADETRFIHQHADSSSDESMVDPSTAGTVNPTVGTANAEAIDEAASDHACGDRSRKRTAGRKRTRDEPFNASGEHLAFKPATGNREQCEDTHTANDNLDTNAQSRLPYNERWESNFQLLVQYKNDHGTTNVPVAFSSLGRWVRTQRIAYKHGTLKAERFALLQSVDFEWQLRECTKLGWEEMHKQLVSYKEQHNGSTNVPQRQGKLGIWVNNQRVAHKKGKLSQQRVDMLESIGFQWQPREREQNPWNQMHKQLVSYKAQHDGFTNVPRSYGKLGKWVNTQRTAHKQGKLSEERVDMLEAIGFQWQLREGYGQNAWNEMYNQLLAYKHQHDGSTNVPGSYGKLGNWVNTQRAAYKKGKLSQQRVDMLESIGFQWQLREYKQFDWNEMQKQLVSYKAQHDGSINVPRSYGKLGIWVDNQRTAHKQGKLSKERVDMLESIGFQWQHNENAWNKMYNQLLAYKDQHDGSTNVPRGNGKLGAWVSYQRGAYKKGKLSQERVTLLEGVGFQWLQNSWNEMHKQLVSYKAEHDGSTNVPVKQSKLGKWVDSQRTAYRKGRLSQDRVALLEDIGFQWNPRDEYEKNAWNEMYKQLVLYKTQHDGSANVPVNKSKLGAWVNTQRKAHKQGKLSQERVALLEGIEFQWQLYKKKRLGALNEKHSTG